MANQNYPVRVFRSGHLYLSTPAAAVNAVLRWRLHAYGAMDAKGSVNQCPLNIVVRILAYPLLILAFLFH